MSLLDMCNVLKIQILLTRTHSRIFRSAFVCAVSFAFLTIVAYKRWKALQLEVCQSIGTQQSFANSYEDGTD